MSVVCPYCQGTTADSQARFCSLCGRQLDAEQLEAATIPDLRRGDVLADPPSQQSLPPVTTLDRPLAQFDVPTTLPPWFGDGQGSATQPELTPAAIAGHGPAEPADSSLLTLSDSQRTQSTTGHQSTRLADQPTEPLDRFQGPIPSFLRATLSGPIKVPPAAAHMTDADEDAQAIFAPLEGAPAAKPAAAPAFVLERPVPLANAAAGVHAPDLCVVPNTPFSASELPVELAEPLPDLGATPPASPFPLYSPHVASRLKKRIAAPAVDHEALLAAAEPPPETQRATAGAGRWLLLLVKLVLVAAVTGASYLLLPAYRVAGAAGAGIALLCVLLLWPGRLTDPDARLE